MKGRESFLPIRACVRRLTRHLSFWWTSNASSETLGAPTRSLSQVKKGERERGKGGRSRETGRKIFEIGRLRVYTASHGKLDKIDGGN